MPKLRHYRPNATGRNDTARFVALPHYLLRCPAWRTMSLNAKALLLDVWQRHNGMNNGEIAYAVREAEGGGLSKDQAARAFAELVERGFLKLHRASTFTLKTKEARTWELTAERRGDQPASKEFMRWQPPSTNHPSTNRTRSHQRDAQSHQRDRQRPKQGFHGRTNATLLIYHVGLQTTATCRTVCRLEPGGGAPTPRRAAGFSPARHRQADPPPPGGAPEPLQIDLEDFIAQQTGQPLAALPSPLDRLRADLAEHVRQAPRGELQRLAERLGLSRPQLSNFKAGRYSLNATATAVLRQILNATAQP